MRRGCRQGKEAGGANGELGHSGDARGGSAGGHSPGRAVAYIGGQGADAASIGASETVVPTLKAAESGSCRTPFVAQLFDRQAMGRYSASGVASTLRSNTSAGYDYDLVVHPHPDATLCMAMPDRKYIVRRLTPVECERLMGFPEGWTDIDYRGAAATPGPRYGAIGNSMAVPCMQFIGQKLLAEHIKAVAAEEDRYEVAA